MTLVWRAVAVALGLFLLLTGAASILHGIPSVGWTFAIPGAVIAAMGMLIRKP